MFVQGRWRESREKEELGKVFLVGFCTFVIVCIFCICAKGEGEQGEKLYMFCMYFCNCMYLFFVFVQGGRRNREKHCICFICIFIGPRSDHSLP